MKEEEIENEFVDEILKKKKRKESEGAIFKKLERINQMSYTQKKLFFYLVQFFHQIVLLW